jgi:glutamine amidotransferase-like uncharacterized protein
MRPYLEKKTITRKRGGVAQGVDPEFKPQYCQKKTKKVSTHNQLVRNAMNPNVS